MAILKIIDSCFFFSKNPGYNFTKKRLHEGSLLDQLLRWSSVYFRHLWLFTSVFNTVTVFLQLHFLEKIIIWLTKQITIPKIVQTFRGKFPWWGLVFINSQGNITEAGLWHWDLLGLSEPATNRNSEEQLSGNHPYKKCIEKVPF